MSPRVLVSLLTACVCFAGCDDDSTAEPADARPDTASPSLDTGLDSAASDGAAPDAAADAMAADAAPDAAPPLVPDELPTEGDVSPDGVDDLTGIAAAGTARAGRVDGPEELITGPEASCRIGDFRLDNAVIALCIQSERSYGQFTFAGGNLVDLAPADRIDSDYFREVIHAPGLGEVSVETIGIVRDGRDGGPAILRTEGTADGSLIIQGVLAGAFVPPPVRVVTEYRLAPDSAEVDILTWISGTAGTQRVRMVDMVYFGDQTRGFPLGLTIGDTPQFIAADGGDFTFGWFDQAQIELFPLVGLELPVIATQSPQLSVRPEDTVLARRRLVLAADVEALRTPFADGVDVEIEGPAGLRADILDADGVNVTRVRIDETGTRTVRLAPGPYTASSQGWPGGDVAAVFVAGTDAAVALDPPVPARLTISARDGDDVGITVQVELSGPGNQRVFVVDEATIDVPPGEWTATTTRGWHYTVDVQPVVLAAGEEARLDVVLEEVIPSDGWAAGEFHQHASPSIDSEVAVTDRILSNIAAGVQFMVPSDHDVIYDYGGLLDEMGLADRISLPLPGEEMSPTFAHIGAYGLPYEAHGGAGGAVPLPIKDNGRWRIRTIPEIIAEARARGAGIIQVNHARESSGLFTHSGYSGDVPIEDLSADRFTTDFDSMEINNRSDDMCQLLVDWMGLLNQGLRVTAVGNSDTHSLGTAPGYPRNYLPTAGADGRDVTGDEIIGAIRAGRVTVGGGAMIDFPEGIQPGDEVVLDDDVLPLRVRVRTPPYAAIDRILAFVNGELVVEEPLISPSESIVDFDGVIDVPVPVDGHVVIMAFGDDSLAHIRPGQPVFALANPVWIDRDGDGFSPTGPVPLTALDLPACQ